MNDPDEVVNRVVDAVSEETGRPSSALPSLYEFVDGDAIRALFEHSEDRAAASPVVEFDYAGTTVRISSNDVVVVDRDADNGDDDLLDTSTR